MSLNGGDPRTYKSKARCFHCDRDHAVHFLEVFDDNTGNAGFDNDAHKNDGGMGGNSASYNGYSQSNGSVSTSDYSSSTMNNHSCPMNQSSNDHGKTY